MRVVGNKAFNARRTGDRRFLQKEGRRDQQRQNRHDGTLLTALDPTLPQELRTEAAGERLKLAPITGGPLVAVSRSVGGLVASIHCIATVGGPR